MRGFGPVLFGKRHCHLTAHVNARIILLPIALSTGGAFIAGSLGALRVTRLQPANAFAQIT
jgi:hypothetical protein